MHHEHGGRGLDYGLVARRGGIEDGRLHPAAAALEQRLLPEPRHQRDGEGQEDHEGGEPDLPERTARARLDLQAGAGGRVALVALFAALVAHAGDPP